MLEGSCSTISAHDQRTSSTGCAPSTAEQRGVTLPRSPARKRAKYRDVAERTTGWRGRSSSGRAALRPRGHVRPGPRSGPRGLIRVTCMGGRPAPTPNIRLFTEQLICGEPRRGTDLLSTTRSCRCSRRCPEVRDRPNYVVMGEPDAGSLPKRAPYEGVLASRRRLRNPGGSRTRQAAGLCTEAGRRQSQGSCLERSTCCIVGTGHGTPWGFSTRNDRSLPVVPCSTPRGGSRTTPGVGTTCFMPDTRSCSRSRSPRCRAAERPPSGG